MVGFAALNPPHGCYRNLKRGNARRVAWGM
jgi:hypothetical protein